MTEVAGDRSDGRPASGEDVHGLSRPAEPIRSATRWHSQQPAGLLLLAVVAVVVAALSGVLGGPTGSGSDPYTVSELLQAREAGTIGRESVSVVGYWTDRLVPHSCAPSTVAFELFGAFCHDGEYGLTEAAEPIALYLPDGQMLEARSPHLTPWIAPDHPDVAALFTTPAGTARLAPARVVLAGHFDDERSSECPASLQERCLDRFVIDELLESEIGKVGADPTAPLPPAEGDLLSPADCGGDVAYSFEGWTTTDELDLEFDRPGKVYAMVTVDPVLLGGTAWNDPMPGGEHRWRVWGRRICIAQAGNAGVVEFGHVRGTDYVEWDDGVYTIGQEQVR